MTTPVPSPGDSPTEPIAKPIKDPTKDPIKAPIAEPLLEPPRDAVTDTMEVPVAAIAAARATASSTATAPATAPEPVPAPRVPTRPTAFANAVWAEFVQLTIIRHPITLFVLLVLAFGVLRIPGLSLDLMGAGTAAPPVFECIPLVLCVCAAWASVVWAQLRPEQRWYAYALPVGHATFLLARATAGALWLILLLGVGLGASLGAGDAALLVSMKWLLIFYALAALLVFALVTALAIVVRNPMYFTMALLAVPLAAGRLLRLNGKPDIANYVDGFILGPRGLLGALTGLTAAPVNAQFALAPAETWPVAAATWWIVALLALIGSTRLMTRR